MKLSIITCTWNSEPWLEQSIASVLAQDCPEIEQVFVDGGSTDGTLERIKALTGNIVLLENVRGGIAHAMNEGARVAKGDIIAHLHSDDIYLGTDTLSKVRRAFEARPEANWLYGRCKSIIEGKVVDNDYAAKPYSWQALIRRNLVPHPACFYKADVFRTVGGFDKQFRYAMDYDMWLKLGKRGAPIQLPDYLAAFRFHPGSLSTANAMQSHNEALRVRLRHVGQNPLAWGEHLARHAYRTVQLWHVPKSSGGCA